MVARRHEKSDLRFPDRALDEAQIGVDVDADATGRSTADDRTMVTAHACVRWEATAVRPPTLPGPATSSATMIVALRKFGADDATSTRSVVAASGVHDTLSLLLSCPLMP